MVPRDLFDAYDSALGASARLLQEAVRAAVPMMDAAGADGWREVYPALVRRYGAFAAAAAVEFYDRLRASADPGGEYGAAAFDPDDGDDLAGDLARALGAGGGPEALAERLAASGKRRVMERADAVLLANAQRDPAHPKWALVPHPGACAWCRFLGSQDFRYSSEATALASRHDNCLCTPVVDFDVDNPSLDGYDPAAYLDEYQGARAEVEPDARAEWAAMPPGERASYAAKGRGAYDRFLRNRIVSAMSRGDAHT